MKHTNQRLTLTVTLANINLNSRILCCIVVRTLPFGIFVCVGCLFFVLDFLALLMSAHTHTPNASLDMDQLNFPKQNPKFKASNTIMRYYFVYRVNKFYYSPVFFVSLLCSTPNPHTHTQCIRMSGLQKFLIRFHCLHKFINCFWFFFGMHVINVYNFVQQNI